MAEEALFVLRAPCAVTVSRAFPAWIARALAALAAALVATAPAAAAPSKGPAWAELTAEQQQILEPLKPEWDRLDRPSRVKWTGIAKRYPSMTATGQRRVQTRMQNWAKLTPEQRAAARNSYRNTIGRLPPEKKQDLRSQWQEYQALPEHEKRNLAAKAAEPKPTAPPKRPKNAPPGGAATTPR